MVTIASSTNIQPRSVNADRGSAWLSEGFGYFQKDALAWIGVTILLVVITLVLAFIPLLGNLAGQLLMPVFMAGMILGCKARAAGGEFSVAHLFAGFGQHTGQLIVLGLLYLIGVITIVVLIAILVFFAAGSAAILAALHPDNVAALQDNLKFFVLVFLVALALYVPLLMAIWFAPALVVLRNVMAIDAMKLSFTGCLLNIVPFLLYGLISLVLFIIAIIPMGLGMLVLIPVITASIYAAYQDIFPE